MCITEGNKLVAKEFQKSMNTGNAAVFKTHISALRTHKNNKNKNEISLGAAT